MRLKIDVDLDYHFPNAAEVQLPLEVAQLPDQRLIEDLLTVNGSGQLHPITGEDGIGRRTWAATQGSFHARYTATVDVERSPPKLETLAADSLETLPAEVVPYLWPSRYCEADRFEAFVERLALEELHRRIRHAAVLVDPLQAWQAAWIIWGVNQGDYAPRSESVVRRTAAHRSNALSPRPTFSFRSL